MNQTTQRTLLIAAGILFFSTVIAISEKSPKISFNGARAATTRNAATCNQTDVQNAINAAVDGDTVIIPAGTCTWTKSVVVGDPADYNNNSKSKLLTLQGAGIDQTIIVDGIDKSKAGIWPDFTSFQPFYWPTKKGALSRLTAMTFQGGTIADPYNKGMLAFTGNSDQLRIDHIKVIPTQTSGVFFYGNIRGVLDHSIFQIDVWKIGIYVFHDSWNDTGYYGDASYADDSFMGTNKAIFVEDNLFTSTAGAPAIDGWSGSRVVFRHNTLRNSAFANHGTESGGRFRGQRMFEVYDNTFSHDTWVYPNVIGIRGGAGVIFNNTATTTGNGFIGEVASMVNYRYSDHSRQYFPFGYCDGTNVWDGNQDSTGYPCLDQPGRGRGNLMSGDDPTPVGWPNQALDPVYAWNNSLNGRASLLGTPVGDAPVVALGRDYFNSQKPGYTPYSYPHPLASGSTTPPPPSSSPVVGDINLDHIVNSIDYSILNADWFTSNSRSDLNRDGIVNAIDYSLLNSNWFKTW